MRSGDPLVKQYAADRHHPGCHGAVRPRRPVVPQGRRAVRPRLPRHHESGVPAGMSRLDPTTDQAAAALSTPAAHDTWSLDRRRFLQAAAAGVGVSMMPGWLDGVAGAATHHAQLAVQDEGIGIPATDLPRIFERYRRGRNVGRIAGTGIGLTGAKQIVERHGGTIDVTSTEGAGTRVTVTADAASRSTFEGWGDSCDGTTLCSIVMDGERSLTARFDQKPDEPLCLEGEQWCPDADRGADDDLEAPDADLEELDELDDAPAPGPDCADGRDNDRDGLTDSAQDPDCDRGSEAGSGAARGTPAPPPRAAPVGDCADGRDNDRDGLTDRAQDPNCLSGDTEAG
ncbi:MAG: hypothetical protein KY433_03185 [Actinobacteria bacterium]|nr:hypothetical protein [Actinomycetota bacterium]